MLLARALMIGRIDEQRQSPLCGLRWLTVRPVSSCLGKGSARTGADALVAVASARLGRAISLDRTACGVVIVLGAARHAAALRYYRHAARSKP